MENDQQEVVSIDELPKEPPKLSDNKLPARWYYRPKDIAKLLKCSSSDLIHYGVIGCLEFIKFSPEAEENTILAGFNEGIFCIDEFGWLHDFPTFLTLSNHHLLSIEQTGKALSDLFPSGYYLSSTYLRKVTPYEFIPKEFDKPRFCSFMTAQEIRYGAEESKGLTEIGGFTSFQTPITKDDLLIPAHEVQRLLNGTESLKSNDLYESRSRLIREGSVYNAHAERHAITRESVLKAAIYCKEKYPDKCTSITSWAECIDNNAYHFWRETGETPLKFDTIKKLLSTAIKEPD